jgi:hypothetical protein
VNIADVSKNAVGIQLNKIASIKNSFPIVGSAMFIDEPIKGTRKAANVAASNADILLVLSVLMTIILPPEIQEIKEIKM